MNIPPSYNAPLGILRARLALIAIAGLLALTCTVMFSQTTQDPGKLRQPPGQPAQSIWVLALQNGGLHKFFRADPSVFSINGSGQLTATVPAPTPQLVDHTPIQVIPTVGQTAFTLPDAGFSVPSLGVYVDGVLMAPNPGAGFVADYALSGATVTFANPAVAGQVWQFRYRF
jgi:hypothetical protein